MIYDLQKASLLKRVSAFIFDGILTVTIAVLVACLVSFATGYDAHYAKLTACYDRYAEEYGITFDITADEYASLSEEDVKKYDEVQKALSADPVATYEYDLIINLTFVIATAGILVSVMLFEFAVPLFFGNGQTLGKKIFSLAVIRTDGVKIDNIILLVRTLLGKFTVEIMVPVMICLMVIFGILGTMGGILLLLLLILQAVCFFVSGTFALIHDTLAKTVVVDMSTQMIFSSVEEMTEYKTKANAERVKKEPY